MDEKDIEAMKLQCEEYLAGWKRAQADYANLKRDTEKEKSEIGKYANERLLSELLPAIDKYELALSHTPSLDNLPEAEKQRWQNWITGLQAVRSLWEQAFTSIGLERVCETGQFDPKTHEAVGHADGADMPDGDIVRCEQPGWTLNGKLIRPARVIISKQP
jgi:molecular chaperone GrpE